MSSSPTRTRHSLKSTSTTKSLSPNPEPETPTQRRLAWEASIATHRASEAACKVPDSQQILIYDPHASTCEVLQDVDLDKIWDDDLSCRICGSKMRNGTARRLPCGHVFHGRCARRGLKKKQACFACGRTFVLIRKPYFGEGGWLEKGRRWAGCGCFRS